jgi:hypothetical protein
LRRNDLRLVAFIRRQSTKVYRSPLESPLWSLAERNSVDAFYRGDVARRIAAAFQKHGGLVTEEIGGDPALLEIVQVPGDHFSSVRPAMNAYLKVIHQSRN